MRTHLAFWDPVPGRVHEPAAGNVWLVGTVLRMRPGMKLEVSDTDQVGRCNEDKAIARLAARHGEEQLVGSVVKIAAIGQRVHCEHRRLGDGYPKRLFQGPGRNVVPVVE